jgi:antitoxin (DNA-binding transcriptional repressor) of toxin-antitoxin stability system
LGAHGEAGSLVRTVKMVDVMAEVRSLKEPFQITSYGKPVATVYPHGQEVIQVGMSCGHEELIERLQAQLQTQSHADVGAVICQRLTEYLRARSLLRRDQSLTYADGKVILRTDGSFDGPSFGESHPAPKPVVKPKESRYGGR